MPIYLSRRKLLRTASARKEYARVNQNIIATVLGISTLATLLTLPYLIKNENFLDMSRGWRRLGARTDCNPDQDKILVIPYIALLVYLFVGLAVLCDKYFEPILGVISERLGLSDDVAGATFMAAGSSAPELFTSLLDAFGPSNSIGIGTIVGSAMFNILVIVALSAAVTKDVVNLDWRPILRDVSFYLLSILLLVIFVKFGDTWCKEDNEYIKEDELDQLNSGDECHYGAVGIVSGTFMVIGYVIYIVFMMFNKRVMSLCGSKKNKIHDVDSIEDITQKGKKQEEGNAGENEQNNDEDDDDDDEPYKPFSIPEGVRGKIVWVSLLPFYVAFWLTIPNVEKPHLEKFYALGFVTCIGWLGVICHFMVQYASVAGCLLEIDPIIMGVTILAAGTSVPDAIASMIVARQGKADMAIANAVGSNVFDILLGLGFPWLLVEAIKQKKTYVDRDGIEIYVFILAGTVALYVLSILLNGFRFTRKLGYFYVLLYAGYVAFVLVSS